MMSMTFKEAFNKFLGISVYVLFFPLAIFFSFELYAIYLQSLSAIPILILLLGVFGILSYYKYNKKIRARYFILVYFLFIGFLALFSAFLIKEMFVIFFIFFDLTIIPFIFLIDKDEEDFMKKQRLLAKIGIYFVDGIFALVIFVFMATSIVLVFSTIVPEQTPFLPNLNANVYYSSSTLIAYKPLTIPKILNFFYLFNPTNQTELEGIANVIKVDNESYNNSFRAYCLNAQTTKYWIQDCISYQPYNDVFSNGQNYMLSTEIWQGQKSLLNVDEIIPNASIYKNQTFYLKLFVKNNTSTASERNNGKNESIKVVLPKNDSFGVIENGSSINTEIHEKNYWSLNTGFLGFYNLNSTITSLSGNFTNSSFQWISRNLNYYFYYTKIYPFNLTNNPVCEVLPVNKTKNTLQNICFEYKMNNTQLKDLQSIENGNCMIFDWGLMYGIPPTATENWSKTPNTILTNLTLCNSNETFGKYLKSINKSI